MHCFYIDGPGAPGALAALLPEEARHAAQVLRLRPGDEICAMDGLGGRFRARIEALEGGAVARLLEALDSGEPPVRLTVYQGLPKADKLELVAQKLTELGAAALVPVRMARCVVKLDDRDARKRRERLQRIAREAAKQCNRGLAPEIALPADWGQALRAMARHALLLVPWEGARDLRLGDVRAQCPDARDIGLVIGPEGGMTGAEVEAMLGLGARAVTLGPRILRTETAAVAAAALAMQLWGDL